MNSEEEKTGIKIELPVVFIIWAFFPPFLQKDLKEITDAFVYKPHLPQIIGVDQRK